MVKLFSNEAIIIESEGERVYLTVKEDKLDIFKLNDILKTLPQIKVTEFKVLKNALDSVGKERVHIGEIAEKYFLEITPDEMTAYLKVNLSEQEVLNDFGHIYSEIKSLLKEKGVQTGIDEEQLQKGIPVGKKFVIAKGIEPILGEDAKYVYYQIGKKTPKVKEDGNSDYYELDLIDNVKAGDWLGEKSLPKNGAAGYTVLGNEIPSKMGRDIKLKYDFKSVDAVIEEEKEVLRARYDGAVAIKHGQICVEKHLELTGNVDYETGNIDFDGSVTIHGTVEDNFKVVATGNIEIKGLQGIGAVDKIISKAGSVVVRGGVNGKLRGTITAKENIYLKFANECILEAGGEIHIGKYAYDSTIKADRILLDPSKGKIVGGKMEARHQIVSGTIGNIQERETRVEIEGFDRDTVMAELEAMKLKLNDSISSANRLKRKLEIFEQNFETLDDRAQNTYKALMLQYESMLDEIGGHYKKMKKYEEILRTRGDGEVKIHQQVYPKTMMELKKIQRQITQLMKCSFYVKGNNILTGD